MLSLARAKQKKGQQVGGEAGARLPPVEAFTFKSFMANLETDEGGHDISRNLDRIAEICARSRYSLSNQYDVHQSPHGSGDTFLAAVSSSRNQPPVGPTLQAVSSDDERNMRRRRRHGGRRRSVAVGTLETIMSSSRSSDEDKAKKKKSAAEIADEVRGRATARKESGNTSPVSSSQSGEDGALRQEEDKKLARKKSAAFATAVIENTRQHGDNPIDTASPRSSASALVSEPALPQTSTSHLEVRPAPDEVEPASQPGLDAGHKVAPKGTPVQAADVRSSQGSLLSTLTGWIPWRNEDVGERSGPNKSEAEGSLRELLKTQDTKPNVKGKGVDRTG